MAVMAACLLASLRSDEIELKTGGKIRGFVMEESATHLRVNLGCGLTSLVRMEDVKSRVKEKPEDVLLWMGRQELSRRMTRRAVRTLEEALGAASPESRTKVVVAMVEARTKLCAEELEARRPSAAMVEIEAALGLMPDNEQILNFRNRIRDYNLKNDALEKEARLAHAKGLYTEAHLMFDKLVDMDLGRSLAVKGPMAECLVAMGDAKLLASDWAVARNYYERALKTDPDLISLLEERWAAANLNPLIEEIEASRYELALEAVERVLALCPFNDNALFFKAQILAGLRKPEESEAAYRRILENHGETSKARDTRVLENQARAHFKKQFNVLPIDQIRKRFSESLPGDWKVRQGEGWVLHHHNDGLAAEISLVVDDALDSSFRALTGSEAPELKPTLHIYIHRDEKEYLEATQSLGWSAGVTRHKGQGDEVLSREIHSYQTAPQLVRAVIPHELMHVAIHSVMPGATLPCWLDEGLAVSNEPAFKRDYFKTLVGQHAAAGDLFSLRDLLLTREYPLEESRVKLFYAQSHVLVDHLLQKLKPAGLLDLIKTFTPDEAGLNLMEEALGKPLPEAGDSLFRG